MSTQTEVELTTSLSPADSQPDIIHTDNSYSSLSTLNCYTISIIIYSCTKYRSIQYIRLHWNIICVKMKEVHELVSALHCSCHDSSLSVAVTITSTWCHQAAHYEVANNHRCSSWNYTACQPQTQLLLTTVT